MGYLNINSKNVSDRQSEAIKKILDKKREEGIINSDIEYEALYQDMLEKISNEVPITVYREQSGQTEPDGINETNKELENDLLILFESLNHTSNKINRHGVLNESIIEEYKQKINNSKNRIKEEREVIENRNGKKIFIESFNSGDSIELDDKFYEEIKNGASIVESNIKCKYNNEKKCVEIETISSENVVFADNGTRLAKIKIDRQLGKDTILFKNPEVDVDKAIDESKETFWSETIMFDEPVNVEMQGRGLSGAMCDVWINLDYISLINEISINTFSEFDMCVDEIEIYTTDDINEKGRVIHFYQEFIDEYFYISFDDISAKRIRIRFNQIHYTYETLLVNKRENEELIAWFGTRKKEINKDYNSKGIYNKERKLKYIESINKEEDLYNLIRDISSPNIIEISKYVYQYGAYNIGIKRNIYNNKGRYVSKRLIEGKSIKNISVEGKIRKIKSLELSEIGDINLYFSIDDINWTKINIVKQSSSENIFLIKTNEVDLSSVRNKNIEKIECNNSNIIKLKHEPWINISKINMSGDAWNSLYLSSVYNPIKVSIINEYGTVINQKESESDTEGLIVNKTNYFNKSLSSLNDFVDADKNYEFIVNENEIIFNKELNSGMNILVEYEHLPGYIRLMIDMDMRNSINRYGLKIEEIVLYYE